MNKCKICANHLEEMDRCKFCSFEYDERHRRDDWDIFELNWDYEIHLDILYRLWGQGIECLLADIWYDNDTGYLLGCFDTPKRIADALNLHEESVYGNLDNGLVVLNLFKEKHLRSVSDNTCEDCEYFKSGALNVCDYKDKIVGSNDRVCNDFEHKEHK